MIGAPPFSFLLDRHVLGRSGDSGKSLRTLARHAYQCYHIGDRKGKEFSCPSCGWKGDADFNGAKNIADLGAVVNQPGGPGLFCLIEAEKVPGLQKTPLF